MKLHRLFIWSVVSLSVLVPLVIAMMSPLQAYRDFPYIAASFAGVLALGILFLQPLLAISALPDLSPRRSRQIHQILGILLLVCVSVHVFGLYLTSPQDALDALLFVAPTLFSVYGVLAMWGVIATVVLVILRTQLTPPYRIWKITHNLLSFGIVCSTIVHALMIEGAMGTASKIFLCGAAFASIFWATTKLRLRWGAKHN